MGAPSPIIGQTLGHYRILEQIGAGGMGLVFRAHDERLDRDVALKVLPPGTLTDEQARKRFRKEALALSKLNHPNIETVHDFDSQDGIDFLVMELVPGVTLDEKLKAGSLSEPEVCRLGAHLAQGLAAAHEHSIIHRDLKPGNLRLMPDGRLKILDFGLAKLLGPATSDATTESLSQTHGAVGTLPYMAPEQLRGEPADARSDIWAAGAVLYEMATGRRPFPQRQGPLLIDAILNRPPEPPSALQRRLSPALENVMLKSLEKDPDHRYQSAREVQVDLERLSAPVTPVRTLARQAWPRHWRRLTLAVGLALLVLAGVAVYRLTNRDKAIDSLAVLPFANVSGDPNSEYLSDGITESLINSLARLPGVRVVSRSSAFRYKGRDVDPRTAGKELHVRAIITGRVLQRGETLVIRAEMVDAPRDIQLWGEQYNRKLTDIFALQEDINRAISRELRLRLSGEEEKRLTQRYTENREAYQLYLKGRYQLNRYSQEGFKEGLAYFNRAIATDPNYALAYAGIADSYYMANNIYLPPREAMPKAKAAAMKALELDESLAEAHSSLGWVRTTYDWDWQDGEKHYKRAIELNPNYAEAHVGYGFYLTAMGRFDEAIAELDRAQQLDPLSNFVAVYSTLPLYFARRYGQAESRLRGAIQADPEFFLSHVFLGLVYEQTGRLPEAISEFEKATRSGDAPLEALAQLGHAYALAGRRDDAKRILESLRTQAATRYVSAYDIAMIHLALGDKDQAFRWFSRVSDDKSEWFAFLKVDPRLDGVRSEPRFQDLVRRIGLSR